MRMDRKVSGQGMKRLTALGIGIMLWLLTTQAFSATETLTLYQDSALTQPATVFPDGGRVYVTVSNGVTAETTLNVLVANRESPPEIVFVDVSDDGQYFDKVANDGVYTGMFIVTTKLTLSPNQAPSPDTPQGTCYKIVKNLHVDDNESCKIMADLDQDGASAAQTIRLTSLFNVAAESIRDTSAVIVWNTSDSGDGKVEYGPTAGYGQISARETPVKDLRMYHEMSLTGLTPGTLYHYRVSSKDTYGKTRVSEECTFTTLTSAQLEAALRAARSQGDLPKIYYVRTDGDNTLDGTTTTTAWKDPSFAVQQAEAGDVIYLLVGTWMDQHLVFAHSGIDIAPITLTTADNGMAVLDGADKTGNALTLSGRAYLEISGVHISNYTNGIAVQNAASHLCFNRFTAENLSGAGATFSGSQPVRRVSFSNFEMSAVGSALYYGSGNNFTDLEINDFYIHDNSGYGIYWRFVEGLHINDGRLINTGSDAVCFSLSTYNSIMENLIVDRTGWHGVAIHDWTTGNYPCFNNTIRNCEITNAVHNHIDLHSGAFNALVEGCTIHEQLEYCTGIFYHNRGEGLIARDNEVYNVSRGFYAEAVGGLVMDRIVLENNTFHDSYYFDVYSVSNNTRFKGNRIYNGPTGEEIYSTGSNVIMEENDINGKTYRFNVGKNNTFRNPKDKIYWLRSSQGSDVIMKYTDRRVYKQQLTYQHGEYTLSTPLWTPEFSYTTLSSTYGYNGITLKITAYPMTATPLTGTAKIGVTAYDGTAALGDTAAAFTSDSGNGIVFTLEELKSDSYYNIYRDGALLASRRSDGSGGLKFTDYSLRASGFVVKETDQAVTGTLSGTVRDETGAPIANAKVFDADDEAFTDANGRYVMANKLIGEYGMTAAANGFKAGQKVAALTAAGAQLDFILRKDWGDARVRVFPNPLIKGKTAGTTVWFDNLSPYSTVRVYSIDGQLRAALENQALSRIGWDAENAASGVYIYLVQSGSRMQKGKCGVVK